MKPLLLAFLVLLLAPATALAADLTVVGLDGQTVVLSANDLAAMPRVESAGAPQLAKRYRGPRLADILARVGAPSGKTLNGKAMRQFILVTGADGFAAVLSLAEVDPGMHQGVVILADEAAGAPLDAKDGPWRLVIDGDLKPARSVRNVVRVELKTAP